MSEIQNINPVSGSGIMNNNSSSNYPNTSGAKVESIDTEEFQTENTQFIDNGTSEEYLSRKRTDFLGRTGAVIHEVVRSIYSGSMGVFENFQDGATWGGDKISQTAGHLVASIVGLFNQEFWEFYTNWLDEDQINTRERIATDYVNGTFVDNYNDQLSEETQNVIKRISRVLTELYIATAASYTPYGLALATFFGFNVGAGKQAQKKYQETLYTTGAEEGGIFFSAVAEIPRYYALSKLGQGVINLVDTIRNYIANPRSVTTIFGNTSTDPNVVAQTTANVQNTVARNTTLGRVLNMLRRGVSDSFRDVGDYLDVAGTVADNVADWLNGNTEFNSESVGNAVLETGVNVGFNFLFKSASKHFDFIADILRKYGAANTGYGRSRSIVSLLTSIVDDFLDSYGGDNVNVNFD